MKEQTGQAEAARAADCHRPEDCATAGAGECYSVCHVVSAGGLGAQTDADVRAVVGCRSSPVDGVLLSLPVTDFVWPFDVLNVVLAGFVSSVDALNTIRTYK